MSQLDDILGKNVLRIHKFFLRNPSIKISYTDLRKKIKIAKATLTKWLNFLLKENLVEVEKIGVVKLFSLNNENIINKELKILDNILSLLPLVKVGKENNVKIYLYGSGARGEDNENSDIDLLVIGKINNKIIADINKISKNIERNIKISAFTQLQWSQMSRKDKPFYERVEKDKKDLA